MNLDLQVLEMKEDYYKRRRKLCFLKFYDSYEFDFHSNDISFLYDQAKLEKLYSINKSITQSLRSTTGKDFECIIEYFLKKYSISYRKQVQILPDGSICHQKNKRGHKVDFVIPSPKDKDSIENYIMLSCKTSLRERYLQDSVYKHCFILTYDTKSILPNVIPISKDNMTFTKFFCSLLTYSTKSFYN